MHYYSAIHFLFSKSLGQKRTDHKANHITKDNFTHVCIFQFSTTCKKKKKKKKTSCKCMDVNVGSFSDDPGTTSTWQIHKCVLNNTQKRSTEN